MALLLRLIDESLNVEIRKGTPCCSSPDHSLLRFPLPGIQRGKIADDSDQPRSSRLQLPTSALRKLPEDPSPLTQLPEARPLSGQDRSELEQIVSEVITDQSYRRTSVHLRIVGSLEIPKSTIHDWIQATPCDAVAQQLEFDFAQILPDGTGYKKRPEKPGGSNRGELKVMVGLDDKGEMTPMGVWSDKSWAEIGTAILDPEEAAKRTHPLADSLVVDGEPGMVEGLEYLAIVVQRCHWHLSRDLGYTMWKDKASLKERKIEASKLSQLIAIELPKETVDEVGEEDQRQLLDRCNRAETELDELIEDLSARGYEAAATYVGNAKRHLFSYLSTWFELGIHCPRTTSRIEPIDA